MQYLQKKHGDEVNFFPEDKHESFLQVDSINLAVLSQACRKYPKQQVGNTLQYVKESFKSEVDFSPAYKHQRFLQIDTIIWCVSKLPKLTSLVFLCNILRKK